MESDRSIYVLQAVAHGVWTNAAVRFGLDDIRAAAAQRVKAEIRDCEIARAAAISRGLRTMAEVQVLAITALKDVLPDLGLPKSWRRMAEVRCGVPVALHVFSRTALGQR